MIYSLSLLLLVGAAGVLAYGFVAGGTVPVMASIGLSVASALLLAVGVLRGSRRSGAGDAR